MDVIQIKCLQIWYTHWEQEVPEWVYALLKCRPVYSDMQYMGTADPLQNYTIHVKSSAAGSHSAKFITIEIGIPSWIPNLGWNSK